MLEHTPAKVNPEVAAGIGLDTPADAARKTQTMLEGYQSFNTTAEYIASLGPKGESETSHESNPSSQDSLPSQS